MRNGSCLKCGANTVYCSNEKYPHNGLKTDSGYPYLNIHKYGGWIPDMAHSEMAAYVCRSCGYFEMYVLDLSILGKLDDCDNWKKVDVV